MQWPEHRVRHTGRVRCTAREELLAEGRSSTRRSDGARQKRRGFPGCPVEKEVQLATCAPFHLLMVTYTNFPIIPQIITHLESDTAKETQGITQVARRSLRRPARSCSSTTSCSAAVRGRLHRLLLDHDTIAPNAAISRHET